MLSACSSTLVTLSGSRCWPCMGSEVKTAESSSDAHSNQLAKRKEWGKGGALGFDRVSLVQNYTTSYRDIFFPYKADLLCCPPFQNNLSCSLNDHFPGVFSCKYHSVTSPELSFASLLCALVYFKLDFKSLWSVFQPIFKITPGFLFPHFVQFYN